MDTPAFLIWSIEYQCPVRGFETGREAERVERLLRAARAASDALQEGRVLDGVCLSPPHGFRLDESLAIYGSQETLNAACHGCPANALSQLRADTWAGCFGMVPLPGSMDELERRLASLPPELGFGMSPPIWPRLWIQSPIEPTRAGVLAALLLAGGFQDLGVGFEELRLGLMTAAVEHLPAHVVAFPPGRAEQGWWRLVLHCPQCKSPWGEQGNRRCDVCGYRGPPAPDKKRRVRGRRPYVLLERLLGVAAAAELLRKYEAAQGQPGSPARDRGPPPPEPPDSPPGG